MLSEARGVQEQDGVRQDRIAQQSIAQKQTPSYQWSSCPRVDIYNVNIVKISGNVNSVNISFQQHKHTTRATPAITNTACIACLDKLSFLGTKYKPCIAPLQHAKMLQYITAPHCISLTHPWADAFSPSEWIALKEWFLNLRKNYCKSVCLASVSPVSA